MCSYRPEVDDLCTQRKYKCNTLYFKKITMLENLVQSGTCSFSSSPNSLQMWTTWGLSLSCWKIVFFYRTKGKIRRDKSSQYLTAFRSPWRWRQQSAPICVAAAVAAHLLCERGNVTRRWRGHSSITLMCSECASWPSRIKEGWGPIHIKGASVDFEYFEAQSVDC